MLKLLSATEAHDRFDEIIRCVTEDNETVEVMLDGEPGFVMLSSAAYERLRPTASEPEANQAGNTNSG